jgi:lysophospholipase L1-like esterase
MLLLVLRSMAFQIITAMECFRLPYSEIAWSMEPEMQNIIIFPKASVTNLGVAGLNTNQALKILENAFDKDKAKSTKAAFERSDIVILDLGRNDRWFFGPPSIALKNLQKIAAKIKSEVTKTEGIPPLVITAVLMSPNRGAQAPWVKVLDQLILAASKPSAPSDLRFDLANKRLLNEDQIHPTSAGYAQIAQIAASYLKKKVPSLMKKLRPDTDGDGISDIVEIAKFGTDPLLVDTDGDGKSDEDEVLRTFSDPLVAD